ncbi:ATP-dependent helicase [Phycisphaera mikurensis]|uniref:DNA 3'-5' helicase n=1 Tax=Phycisphaera mikurensis (strain NBRC 102666 / KCTC 22515 / FYK2301M01) TaxID=1142394 RepID=I0IF03_PHYMF|nr:UvrD-helicase domain-containing protein [Phycisphaera mikurensis]MBB6441635.1 DNA helicase-2/ATP-dependent DNA helicase PcrA [Phycisphaera mikurensis]BAM03841.1 ATP-dependent DNA helicase PcrA [Phycisphaera mikurensis NBRC 102666]
MPDAADVLPDFLSDEAHPKAAAAAPPEPATFKEASAGYRSAGVDHAAELTEGLTEPQAEAVAHVDGPLLVLAGPGSGKTRVITRRVAYLVRACGVPPWHVLAITFTNKAAGEMRERVAQLLTEKQARAATVSTFHALCARLIRQHAERVGLPPGYSIYDTADQKAAIKTALSELEINPKNFAPASMLAGISNAKNELLTPAAYQATASDFHKRTVAKVYAKYQQILVRNSAVDFDDLLMKTVELCSNHPDVLAELQDRFRYILVDEYQDTNRAQFMIADFLAKSHHNLMVTGDPDQSIYGWRGADIRNILDFETGYAEAKTIRLEQNYRSTKTILAAADALIANNARRKAKRLFTDNDDGGPVVVTKTYDQDQEAQFLAERLKHHHDAGTPWSDMAVFYRINSLSRSLEDALRDGAIPYQIARGTAFYDRKEVKDALAFLRAIANPADEVTHFRIINTPARGISAASVKAIRAHTLATDQPLNGALADPEKIAGLNNRAQVAVAKFHAMLEGWRQRAGLVATPGEGLLVPRRDADPSEQGSLADLVRDVIDRSGLDAFYRNDKSDPDQERLANLGELVTSVTQFEEQMELDRLEDDPDAEVPGLGEKLLGFLERVALVADADSIDAADGSVTLMTLHAAKGLEFPVVGMIALEDGLLPHQRAAEDEDEMEEERRLAFVGITRAERHLYLTSTKYRTVFGRTNPTVPSRFLDELPESAVERRDIADDALDGGGFTHRRGQAQRNRADREADAWPPGTEVRHPQFGRGRIRKVDSMGAHTRASVEFQTHGLKTMILQYARLERV